MDVETLATTLAGQPDTDKAFSIFCKFMHFRGFSAVGYCKVRPGNAQNDVVKASFPKDWTMHYMKNDYARHDPLFDYSLHNLLPFEWQKVAEITGHTGKRILREAGEFGLNKGYALGLRVKNGEHNCISVCEDDTSPREKSLTVAEFYFASAMLNEHMTLISSAKMASMLTVRETDVVLWAAEGLTDTAIADRLSISHNTVRYHWKSIFIKLKAKNKIHAVAIALTHNLIRPLQLKR